MSKLDDRTKEILFNVYNFLKEDKIRVVLYMTQIRLRTAKATGVSPHTISRIVRRAKTMKRSDAFRTPGKNRKRVKQVRDIDPLDLGAIKRSIHSYYVIEKQTPTTSRLTAKLKKTINYGGRETTLNRLIVKDLGFQFLRKESQIVILERPIDRLERIEYLAKIKRLRDEGRHIVYLAAAVVYPPNARKTAKAESAQKRNTPQQWDHCIMARAWSGGGNTENELLVVTSLNKVKVDYTFLENLLKIDLIPKLRPNSVVVLDQVPYQNKPIDPPPSRLSPKSEVEAWLTDRGVPFREGLHKAELYDLVQQQRARVPEICSVDEILSQHGHVVLRVPPYHPDLDPVRISAANGDVGMDGARWAELCARVLDVEEQYRQSERSIDDMTDAIDLRFVDSDDSADGFSSDEEPSDSDASAVDLASDDSSDF